MIWVSVLLVGFWCLHHHPSLWLRAQLRARGREKQQWKIGSLCQPAQHQRVCVFSIHEALREFQSSDVFSSVACCIKWHLPPCGIGVGVETCVTFSLVEPTDLRFLYMFSVFPLFSLSTCTSWTCLLWMCAVVPFHLISPLAVDHTKSKTTANMRLLNGFPFSPPPPPLSLFSCLSIFIMPLQVFKQTNAWRSLRWLKMHQGWYLTEGIPLMKTMKGHTAVRQITHSSHPHCPGYPQTQTLIFISAVLKSQKEKSTLTSLVLQNLTHWAPYQSS